MTLELTRRLVKGSRITAAEHDANLDVLETAIEARATAASIAALNARLDAFRDAKTFYVSKRNSASNSNNGTSPGEPFATPEQAVAAAVSYRAANPNDRVVIELGPGVWQCAPLALPTRTLLVGPSQRTALIQPTTGTELQNRVLVDSGCMVMNLTFAGHQATGTSTENSSTGTRAWAIAFNQAANGGQGPIITESPYIKDCLSRTGEDDEALGGSTTTGDTGGGVEVDGLKVHPSSPLRSMVVYGFTQQNLGGPGAVVKNDAYCEFVSFFGIFCTWHIMAESGGQATLSGGGSSEFGIYGLVADGYSPTPIFTGSLRAGASAGALEVDVVSFSANRIGAKSRPNVGQVLLLGGSTYVVQSALAINSAGVVVAEDAVTKAGYRVSIYNPTGLGLTGNVSTGAACDFRQHSSVSAGFHTCLYVGSGTNYNALPLNGGVQIEANEFVERNFGRVYGTRVNNKGNITAAGGAFSIDGTTGAVTINTDEFNLSGLNAIGPFSRNGGISTVGVQLREVSNDVTLTASTGTRDGNTAPTQFAVHTYAEALRTSLLDLLAPKGSIGSSGLTQTAGILGRETGTGAPQVLSLGSGLSITGGVLTPAVSAYPTLSAPTGFSVSGSGTGSVTLTFASGYSLPTTAKQASWDTAAGQAATAVQPAALTTTLSSYLTIAAAGTTYQPLNANLTALAGLSTTTYGRGFNALADAAAGRSYLSLATVASTGAYGDLSGRPTLGTAAALDHGTAAGNLVRLDPTTGKLPAVDASQLTGLPAAPVSSVAGRTGAIVLTVADVSGLGSLATQSGTFSGTSSGTNTGDQTITLTGDATGSGTGDRKSTRLNSSHVSESRMPSSA